MDMDAMQKLRRLRQERKENASPLRKQPQPQWVPYPPPPESRTERVRQGASRYGVAAVLAGVFAVLLGLLVYWQMDTPVPWPDEPAARQAGPPGASNGGLTSEQGGGLYGMGAPPYEGEATLTVTTEPSGALVIASGDTLGRTPLRNEPYVAGARLISVWRDGYAPADSVVLLRNDAPTVLHFQLETRRRQTPRRPQAQADAAGAQEQQTTNADAYWYFQRRTDTYLAEGALRAARRALDTALDYRPDDEEARALLERLDERIVQAELDSLYNAYRFRGDALLQRERYVAARLAYEEALRLHPGDRAVEAMIAQIDRILSEASRQRQQYQYHRGRGDALFEARAYAQAAESYRQALAHNPGDAYAQERLAEGRRRAEATPEAGAVRGLVPDALGRTRGGDPAPEPGDAPPPEETPPEETPPEGAQSGEPRMNLNAATFDQLDRLPGIGPVLAGRIVTYREENGPFRQVDELTRVRGIGPKTLAALRPLLFVTDE